jgi:hypothetical protein
VVHFVLHFLPLLSQGTGGRSSLLDELRHFTELWESVLLQLGEDFLTVKVDFKGTGLQALASKHIREEGHAHEHSLVVGDPNLESSFGKETPAKHGEHEAAHETPRRELTKELIQWRRRIGVC